ncbi:MAG: glycosyl hydrolase family 28 protein [Treponema sp.]|nr:glycosyl hydrolase family 28 protein [Treponema sp.]
MAESELALHPLAHGIRYTHHNNDFSVTVRQPGGDWQDLFEYKVMVDMDDSQSASMVQFDFFGRVEVRAKFNYGVVNSAVIRPLSKNIKPEIKGNYVSFFLDEPAKLSVEINGDRRRNLHVFANSIETEKYDSESPGVMYFGEGIHLPDDNDDKKGWKISSNTTVYLAAGSVLRGKLICDTVENVRIIGRGIFDNPENGIDIRYSKNVEVSGFTFINPLRNTVCIGQCRDVKVSNIKSFSNTSWSDGINIYCSENVEIDDVFLRTSDDCIAIYGHRWKFFGDVKNCTIKNSILWADIAHPINIGTHGNTSIEGDTLENFLFSNIDILEHDEDDREYQGCMALSFGDHNLAKDFVFENIRVENIMEGQLFNLRVFYNEKYCTGPGRGIQNIVFRNISYNWEGWPENPGIISGYDSERMIKDVKFENIVINGKRAKSFEDANIRMGEFTKNITIE